MKFIRHNETTFNLNMIEQIHLTEFRLGFYLVGSFGSQHIFLHIDDESRFEIFNIVYLSFLRFLTDDKILFDVNSEEIYAESLSKISQDLQP